MFHGPVPVLHRLQQYLIKLRACLHPKFLVTPRATLLFFFMMEAHDTTGGGTVETDSTKIIKKSDAELLAMQPSELLAWAKKSVMRKKNDRIACNLIVQKMIEIANEIPFETTSEPVPFYPADILHALPVLLENVSDSSTLYYSIFSGRIRHGKGKETKPAKKFQASHLKLLVQFQGPVFLDYFKDERKKARTGKQEAPATEPESQAVTGGDASFATTDPEPFDKPLQSEVVVQETQEESALSHETIEETVTRLKALIKNMFLNAETEKDALEAANNCLKMMASEGAEICNREDLVKFLCKTFVNRKINLKYKLVIRDAPHWATEESLLMNNAMKACVKPAGISDFDQILSLEFYNSATRQMRVPDPVQLGCLAIRMEGGCKYLLTKLLESEGKSTGAATAADPPSTSAAASSTGQAATPASSSSKPAPPEKLVSAGIPTSSSSARGGRTDKAQGRSSVSANTEHTGEHVQMELVNVSRQFAEAENMEEVSQLFTQFCNSFIEEDTEMGVLKANSAIDAYLKACVRLQSPDGKVHGDQDNELVRHLMEVSTDERSVERIHTIIKQHYKMLSGPIGFQQCTDTIVGYLSFWRSEHRSQAFDFSPESLRKINPKDQVQMYKIELCFKQRFDSATSREETATAFGQLWNLYMKHKGDIHSETLTCILHKYVTKAVAESTPHGFGQENLKELTTKQLETFERKCSSTSHNLRDPIKIHNLLFPVQTEKEGHKIASYTNIGRLAKAIRARFYSVKSEIEEEAERRVARQGDGDSGLEPRPEVKKARISTSNTSRTPKRALESPTESSAESTLRDQNLKWWREVGEPKRQRGFKLLEEWKSLTTDDIPFLKGKH